MSYSLSQWLDYQQQTHPRSIELGLERVREVWQRMGSPRPAPEVITVAGTNGKGSTVALLQAILQAAGYRVGSYTSPHLNIYNERIRIGDMLASDADLVAAFERIERARAGLGLTYFEFGTLAALDLLARAELDVAILEVGLGGRLDAVNIIDADIAVVTTIDLDHTDWLGPDRDSIGREKAGIVRAGRPVIVGEADPGQGLLAAVAAAGAQLSLAGRDFGSRIHHDGWQWWQRDGQSLDLPLPALRAPVQVANAATAIAALRARDQARPEATPWLQPEALKRALGTVQIAGRLQALGGEPPLYLDVAHNPQAARSLASWLDQRGAGPVHAIYGALADKDVGGVIAALGSRISHWHLVGLDVLTPRGLPVAALAQSLHQVDPAVAYSIYPDLASALAGARAAAGQAAATAVLGLGSFYVVSELLALQQAGGQVGGAA